MEQLYEQSIIYFISHKVSRGRAILHEGRIATSEDVLFVMVGKLGSLEGKGLMLVTAEQMFAEDFAGRVLPFDAMAARAFGPIVVGCCRKSRQGSPSSTLGKAERASRQRLSGDDA